VTSQQAAQFSVRAQGAITDYRWEVQAGPAGWSGIPGAASPLLTISASLAIDGTRYRVVVTGPGGATVSQAATLRVRPIPTRTRARFHRIRGGRARVNVSVTPEGGTTPTGTVAVYDRNRRLRTAELDRAGHAVLRVRVARRGIHRLVVRYLGSPDALPSTSKITMIRTR
jgi:hypothetical protein